MHNHGFILFFGLYYFKMLQNHGGVQDCGHIASNGQWYDASCSDSRRYICGPPAT